MKHARTAIVASFAATMAVALAGCSGSGGDANGTVEIWSQIQGAEAQQYYRDAVIGGFEQDNPGSRVEVSFKNADDITRLVGTAVQSGNGPDLVPSTGPASAIEFAKAGAFAPLDDYAAEYDWESKILPWALEFGKIDGELLMLPNEYETMVLYYNETLFAENGWTPPTSREELEELAGEMTAKGITPFAAGSADFSETPGWYLTFALNNFAGPDLVRSALKGETPWTDPELVDAISLLDEYFQNGWLGGGVQPFLTGGFDQIHTQFGNGEAGMLIEGTWFLEEIDSFFGEEAGNGNDWAWAPLPALSDAAPADLFTLGIGSTISLAANSDAKDEAAMFLDWYYSDPPRIAERIAAVPGRMNVPVEIAEDEFPSSMDPRVADILSSLSQSTATGDYGFTAWTFWPPKSYQYMNEKFQNVLLGQLSAEDYMQWLDDVFQQELADGAVIPGLG